MQEPSDVEGHRLNVAKTSHGTTAGAREFEGYVQSELDSHWQNSVAKSFDE
jgi:hypothetical protein